MGMRWFYHRDELSVTSVRHDEYEFEPENRRKSHRFIMRSFSERSDKVIFTHGVVFVHAMREAIS